MGLQLFKQGGKKLEASKSRILVIIGLVVGMLSFLFLIADSAISYSDNARFCLNCHSMNEAYETLQHSSHKQFKCTECHAPHSYVPKVAFKMKSGLRDLYVTALGEVPQVFRATEESKEIISDNCARCHYATVERIGMGQGRSCMDCHRDIAHVKKSLTQ